MARKPKSVMGRPVHEASDANKSVVKMFTAAGLTQLEIAKHLKIDRKTLAKHYEHELETGWIDAIGTAATTIIEEMNNKTSEKRLDAAKFFLSRRGRGMWSEQKNLELSGPNGGAIPIAPLNLDAIDYEELEAAYEIIAPALLTGPVIEAELEDDDGDAETA
jgi:hypothetical protein